ncbi:Sulfur relay protein, TusE/DsrC/DsvC family [Syntrophobacter sp. SbD2]|nr:Sulfur relay protein, TusE/DsrC/DsvC family [Syntrophobacter sp. SbD2]
MGSFVYKDKVYEIDENGFLLKPEQWDEDFARGMAPNVGIREELTHEHWCIMSFIRNAFSETGRCPMIHQIGKDCGLKLQDLKKLFPSGYLRGACKLAGLTYLDEEVHSSWLPSKRLIAATVPIQERKYRVNIRGFLLDPLSWDEEYAVFKAEELKMPALTEKHWQIIRFLREQFEKNGTIPTAYETCEANQIEIEDVGLLFPDGYHRGAVKIAGLSDR